MILSNKEYAECVSLGRPIVCRHCKVVITGEPIKCEPCRHASSPNGFNEGISNPDDLSYCYYCSDDCRKNGERETYIGLAEVDCNCSDCVNFCHKRWEGGKGYDRVRIGTCPYVYGEFKVLPLSPSNNSYQPKCGGEFGGKFVLRTIK